MLLEPDDDDEEDDDEDEPDASSDNGAERWEEAVDDRDDRSEEEADDADCLLAGETGTRDDDVLGAGVVEMAGDRASLTAEAPVGAGGVCGSASAEAIAG